MRLPLILVLSASLTSVRATCQSAAGGPLDSATLAASDLATAAHLGLTERDVLDLKAARGLSNRQLLETDPRRLSWWLVKLRMPRPDSPAEADAWRALSHLDEFGRIAPDGLLTAKNQMLAMQRLAPLGVRGDLDSTKWTALGPGNVGGRIRAVAIHPSAPARIFVGSVSGGIWRSDDGGGSWVAVDDLMTNLAVTSIVIHPTQTNVMYAATGEGFVGTLGNSGAQATRGAGIFKSTDGGSTWNRLSATNNSSFWWVNRLAISPNGNVLLASTGRPQVASGGVFRSTDGGNSWSSTTPNAAYSLDVEFHPSNSNIAVAHVFATNGLTCAPGSTQYGHVAGYSTDGGTTWLPAAGLPVDLVCGVAADPYLRIEFAFHRGWTGASNGCVYASSARGAGQIYRSTNGGASYALVSTPGHLATQGWYDNAIWVDPSDTDANPADDRVVIGGIDLFRSTNGGSSFTQISDWRNAGQPHADQHAIVADPGFDGTANKRVFIANDGGMWKTNNIFQTTVSWVNLDHDLAITQFYSGARPTGGGALIGGTQDNGTLRYSSGTTWCQVVSGDGGPCAVDPTNSTFEYGQYVSAQVQRFNGSCGFFEWICGLRSNGTWKGNPYLIDDAKNGRANFIAPMVIDPNAPQRLLVGGSSLWRTDDARTANTTNTGPTWAAIKSAAGTNYISAIAIDPADSDRVWVGHNNGDIWFTSNGTAGAPGWTKVDGTLPNRMVTRLTVDPSNGSRVLACLGGFASGNLWLSTNSGTTWTGIGGSLPSAPVRDVAIHPTKPNWLYAATEVGLLVSEDGGATWSATATPANVSIDELFWSSGHLYLVTHGRGMFHQTPIPALVELKGSGCEVNGSTYQPSFTVTPPILGQVMTLSVAQGPPSKFGLVYYSPIPACLCSTPYQNCEYWVDPAAMFILFNVVTDPAGNMVRTVTLPNDPTLAGQRAAMQPLFFGGGTWFGNGAWITIGY
ncbi:MAG: hypothetical protein R3F56_01770 [Planctomycetota bacterium]